MLTIMINFVVYRSELSTACHRFGGVLACRPDKKVDPRIRLRWNRSATRDPEVAA